MRIEQLKPLEIAAGEAAIECSRIFSRWLKSDVTIAMEKVAVIPFHEVASLAAPSGTASVGIYMRIEKGMAGGLLLFMPEQAASDLVSILMKKGKGASLSLGEIERSALNETANIIGCAYLNRLCGRMNLDQVTPSPPVLMHDLSDSIMNSILMEQAEFQEESLLIEVEFFHEGKKLDLKYFFLPIFASIKGIEL